MSLDATAAALEGRLLDAAVAALGQKTFLIDESKGRSRFRTFHLVPS